MLRLGLERVVLRLALLAAMSGCSERFIAGSLGDAAVAIDLSGLPCPVDLAAAIGSACGVQGQSCGSCPDPCAAECRVIACTGGSWMQTIGQGSCLSDMGPPATACSPACGTQETCIYFVPGLPPPDGGTWTPMPTCRSLPTACANPQSCACLAQSGNTSICMTICQPRAGYLECMGI